jgi:hypothetical protein
MDLYIASGGTLTFELNDTLTIGNIGGNNNEPGTGFALSSSSGEGELIFANVVNSYGGFAL